MRKTREGLDFNLQSTGVQSTGLFFMTPMGTVEGQGQQAFVPQSLWANECADWMRLLAFKMGRLFYSALTSPLGQEGLKTNYIKLK